MLGSRSQEEGKTSHVYILGSESGTQEIYGCLLSKINMLTTCPGGKSRSSGKRSSLVLNVEGKMVNPTLSKGHGASAS